MTVDDIVKLMLFGSISLSILLLSFQSGRILGKVADILQDFRTSVKNIGSFTTQLVEDYTDISGAIKSLLSFFNHFNDNILVPISRLTKTIGKYIGANKED